MIHVTFWMFLRWSAVNFLNADAAAKQPFYFIQVMWCMTAFRHFNGEQFSLRRNMNPMMLRALKCPGCDSVEWASEPLITTLESSDRGLSLSVIVCSQMLSAGLLESHMWNGHWRQTYFLECTVTHFTDHVLAEIILITILFYDCT